MKKIHDNVVRIWVILSILCSYFRFFFSLHLSSHIPWYWKVCVLQFFPYNPKTLGRNLKSFHVLRLSCLPFPVFAFPFYVWATQDLLYSKVLIPSLIANVLCPPRTHSFLSAPLFPPTKDTKPEADKWGRICSDVTEVQNCFMDSLCFIQKRENYTLMSGAVAFNLSNSF